MQHHADTLAALLAAPPKSPSKGRKDERAAEYERALRHWLGAVAHHARALSHTPPTAHPGGRNFDTTPLAPDFAAWWISRLHTVFVDGRMPPSPDVSERCWAVIARRPDGRYLCADFVGGGEARADVKPGPDPEIIITPKAGGAQRTTFGAISYRAGRAAARVLEVWRDRQATSSPLVRKGRKPRKTAQSSGRPLTEKQAEAVEVLAACRGSHREAARRLCIDESSLRERVNSANRKLETVTAGKSVRPRQRLPHDA